MFPDAAEIDAADVLPRRYLDVLAAAGLYGLFGPAECGGFDADPVTAGRVVEALGGASLTTTFVWIQHHSVVRAVAGGPPPCAPVARASVPRNRPGRNRLCRPAPARPAGGHRPPGRSRGSGGPGWVLNGQAPWVTGWERIDVLLAGARAGPDVVWVLLDAVASPTETVRRVGLDALQASSTVTMEWRDHQVPPERVVAVEPYADWQRRDAQGRQLNGYLAIGVAARCARLLGRSGFGPAGLGHSGLEPSIAAARQALDSATVETVVAARTEASLLAVRAAAALVAAGGGRSVETGSPAARLMREAMFLLVFGQTRPIRAAQLDALGARHRTDRKPNG